MARSTAASPAIFAQVSTDARQRLLAHEWSRVAVARSADDAMAIVHDCQAGNVRRLGDRLGYPNCCIEWAEQNDHVYTDTASGVLRQSNLHDLAIMNSKAADFRCNYMLTESLITDFGPASLISHYPCQLDCPQTVVLAEQFLNHCSSVWPRWASFLANAQKSPVFHWSDVEWASRWWDECCGLCLLSGVRLDTRTWRSEDGAVVLGSGRTPAGEIPADVTEVEISGAAAILRSSTKSVALDRWESGIPSVVDFAEGTVLHVHQNCENRPN